MIGKQVVHPARETLTAFGTGKLDPVEALAVEEHIAECEECCETLHGLGSDTFLDLLRESDELQLDAIDDTTESSPSSHIGTCTDLPSELENHPRYRVWELLGKGGMGNVYRAEHKLMNRSVALKIINRELVRNSQAVERFRREFQAAAQLAHPNIVTAYDAEQAADIHFLVMEYVPGSNLSDVVKRDGPLSISLACDYVCQAAQGLQHAHENGMVHRDVKPHNLMVSGKGEVKILDFGLATLAAELQPGDEDKLDADGSSPNLTSMGSAMGTPDFMSPEQANNARTADIRSDIYSLGCTFYYLLTGRAPFTEGSAQDRMKAHRESEPDPIVKVRPDIQSELAEIVNRMIAKKPGARFQSPAEVVNALTSFAKAGIPVAKTKARAKIEAESSHRSWRLPTIPQMLACVAFASIPAAVIYFTTNTGTLVNVAAVNEQNNVGSSKKGTTIEVLSREGTVSPDLVKVATAKRVHSNGGDSPYRLYIKKRNGGATLEVAERFEDGQPSNDFAVWSHDSKWLAYVVFVDSEPHRSEVRIASSLDGSVKRVSRTNDWWLTIQDWSRNGKSILCVARRKDNTSALVTISVDDDDSRNVTTFEAGTIGHARFSPDEKHIVFHKGKSHSESRVHVVDVDGTRPARLTESSDTERNPIWSIDGKNVIYTGDGKLRSVTFDRRANTGQPRRLRPVWFDFEKRLSATGDVMFRHVHQAFGLYTSNISDDGASPPRRIEQISGAMSPAWSPDGERIAFTVENEVKILSLSDGKIEPVNSGFTNFISWSPDGRTLVMGPGTGGRRRILKYSLESRKVERILLLASDVPYPVFAKGFSQDGQRFVLFSFVGKDGQEKQNVAFDINTGEEHQVEFDGCDDPMFHYDISPDGKWIAYVTNEPKGNVWKLIVADLTFQKKTVIARQQRGHAKTFTYPRWSPSSDRFLYLNVVGDTQQICLSTPDGEWQHQVAMGKLNHRQRRGNVPCWSPDGTKIAYSLRDGPYWETRLLRNILTPQE